MAFPSSTHNSQRLRKPSPSSPRPTNYRYQDSSLAGPTFNTNSSQTPHQYQEFGSLGSSEYLPSDYSSASAAKPSSTGLPNSQQDYYQTTANYYPRADENEDAMMMSQREMSYGYLPNSIHNSMPSYPPGQPYGSQHLAPLPGYYADSQAHRNMAGSSRPSSSQPLHDFQSFNSPERDPSSLQSRKRRRTSQAQDDRRQTKLRVRRNRLPGITNISLDENNMVGGSVDIFPLAPASSPYVQDSVDRSHTRTSMSPSYRNDYHDVSPGNAQYVQQPYHPGYTMGPMNPSSLAPPILPNTAPGYNTGRSSPMLQAPLPPAPVVSPHVEPVVLDRREKPQCWDHGCNGREFSTFSNLLRHQREKSGSAAKSYCPHCGAEFTRTTARNGHMEHGKCKTRRTSNANTDTANNSNSR